MIKNFPLIKNVISFIDYESAKYFYKLGKQSNRIDIDFGKNNIIFGDNGSGKSTLVQILKNLNGDNIILEKNWDYKNENQEIKINTENGTLSFNAAQWDGRDLNGKIIVFDKDFIKEKVHLAGDLKPEHQKSMGGLLIRLGNFDKLSSFLDFIQELKNEIEKRNESFLSLSSEKIDKLCRKEIIDFIQLKQEISHLINFQDKKRHIKQITSQLNEKKNKLEKSKEEIENIKQLAELQSIEEPEFLNLEDLQETLGFGVTENVLKSFESLRTRIEGKEDFIREGLEILQTSDNDICPFCHQRIIDKEGHYLEIIEIYKQIFSEEFENNLRDNLEQIKSYRNILGEMRQFKSSSVGLHLENQGLFNKFEKFYPEPLKEITQRFSFTRTEEGILDEIEQVISRKERSNLEKLSIKGETIKQAKEIIEKIKTFIISYNKEIEGINNKIRQFRSKDEASIVRELKDIKTEIDNIRLKQFFLTHKKEVLKYKNILDDYKKNEQVIENIQIISDQIESKIEKEFDKFSENYFQKIRNYAQKMDSSLTLDILGKGSYDKRFSEATIATFELQFENKKVEFKTLSEGEKQTIALAFFFALLEDEEKDKVVVLDDPVINFDAGKRKIVAELIRNKLSSFQQVFVLTCDPLFERYCKTVLNNSKLFWILKNGYKAGGSFIFPVEKTNLVADFKNDLENIILKNPKSLSEIITAGQKLRYCVEMTVKDELLFHSIDKVNEILEQLEKDPGKISRLAKDTGKITDLISIYQFCNLGGALHFDKANVSSWTEMKFYIQKYLNLGL